MVPENFKESGFMYAIALAVVVFVIAQSVFFIVKSWKRAKELGIKKETLKNTAVSSAVFTVAPAISILATVIVLANALGIVLPWIRLTVIGNLAYETTAAQTALDFWGGSLKNAVTDPQQFSTIAWAMTVGSIAPLILLPFLCKKLQNKIGDVVNKSEKSKKLGDAISAAAFIGIISAFLAREINGNTVTSVEKTDALGNVVLNADGAVEKVKMITGSAGAISILTLISAMVFMVILTFICKRFKLDKLEPFTMPLAMFGAMGMAILLTNVLPESVSGFYWYDIGTIVG
ncbi:MAG: DUF5058 family protein [Clostridia bacterium]|nr:DUF5058 family protein [Clostridia bacterium]